MKINLIIVRHGFSTSNAHQICNDSFDAKKVVYDYRDSPLTLIGIEASKRNGVKLMQKLKEMNLEPDLVGASVLSRALETAKIMTNYPRVISMPYLKEGGRSNFPPNWPTIPNIQREIIGKQIRTDLVPVKSDVRTADGDIQNDFIPWLLDGGLSKSWKLTRKDKMPDEVVLLIVCHGGVMDDFLEIHGYNDFQKHPANNEAYYGSIIIKNKELQIGTFKKLEYPMITTYPKHFRYYLSDPNCEWAKKAKNIKNSISRNHHL
jgi:broad specificity phosphatase PhoE